jgi:hypothetical protein
LQDEQLNVKHILTVMGKMNETMISMVIQLKAAIEQKHESSMKTFSNQLKSCTSFISNEINHIRGELVKVKDNDEVECLRITRSCEKDLKRFWIRFVYAEDAEECRDKNTPAAIKEIFDQLQIPIEKMEYPLESFFFTSKDFSEDQLVPEIALSCTFVNSTLAGIVKNGIRKFNRHLEEQGLSHLIRYFISTDWSYEIRSILKPCNEMKRCGVIDKVLITNDGLKVYHKELTMKGSNNKNYSHKHTYANSHKKLDALRKMLHDYKCSVPAREVYNSDYFKLTVDERKSLRERLYVNSNVEDEYECEPTDDEDMNKSFVPIRK